MVPEVASTRYTVATLVPRVGNWRPQGAWVEKREPGTRVILVRFPCPLSLPLTYLLCIPRAAGGDVQVDKTLLHENCLSVALWRDPLGADWCPVRRKGEKKGGEGSGERERREGGSERRKEEEEGNITRCWMSHELKIKCENWPLIKPRVPTCVLPMITRPPPPHNPFTFSYFYLPFHLRQEVQEFNANVTEGKKMERWRREHLCKEQGYLCRLLSQQNTDSLPTGIQQLTKIWRKLCVHRNVQMWGWNAGQLQPAVLNDVRINTCLIGFLIATCLHNILG